ncbi:unnamed protein product [Fructobacillus fructosus]|uniref:Uncharacterized protein n=1 Tax=Fructobacillus fructosus TaxID=1631 RepID=A0ABM9MZ85_9LACO|nr:unnamed protein product [Fructobacillus fructosus]
MKDKFVVDHIVQDEDGYQVFATLTLSRRKRKKLRQYKKTLAKLEKMMNEIEEI